jgi:hypothetical protein
MTHELTDHAKGRHGLATERMSPVAFELHEVTRLHTMGCVLRVSIEFHRLATEMDIAHRISVAWAGSC